MGDPIHYQSGEYCEAVGCDVQTELGHYEKGSPEYDKIKQTCQTGCKKTAWDLHDWLKRHGYLIIKENK